MVASLGFDVATCCAASRAGLSRAQPNAAFPVMTASGDDVGVACHSVPITTGGFEGELRLQRLAAMALRDLDQREPWLRVGTRSFAYLSLPPSLAHRKAAAAAEPDSAALTAAVQAAWPGAQALWARAIAPLRWTNAPTLRHLALSGHTGFLRALEQATRDIAQGQADVAIVGGVDSWIDLDTMAWLESRQRLKTPSSPAGFQPGEAAAFVVLESETHATARGGISRAFLRGLAFGQEVHLPGADDPPSGKALAGAIHNSMRNIRFHHQLPLWVLSDHNGEPYRAQDWGTAAVHLEAAHKTQVVGPTTYPATSFGDTGAASGAIALCMAARAFERRYASASIAAVVSAADSGDRGVLLCQAA